MSGHGVLNWHEDAACREVDAELFFPDRGLSSQPAKQVCGVCPVRAECLDEALSFTPTDDFGVRGGLSERERKALRRQGQKSATVTPLPRSAAATDAPRRAAA